MESVRSFFFWQSINSVKINRSISSSVSADIMRQFCNLVNWYRFVVKRRYKGILILWQLRSVERSWAKHETWRIAFRLLVRSVQSVKVFCRINIQGTFVVVLQISHIHFAALSHLRQKARPSYFSTCLFDRFIKCLLKHIVSSFLVLQNWLAILYQQYFRVSGDLIRIALWNKHSSVRLSSSGSLFFCYTWWVLKTMI